MMGIIFKCFPILHPKIIFLHHVTFAMLDFDLMKEVACLKNRIRSCYCWS